MWLINAVIYRNVRHLGIMVANDFWVAEDMTAVNAAIVDGNRYLSS